MCVPTRTGGCSQDMPRLKMERSVITFSSLISACEKAGQWQTALRVFGDMRLDNCEPNNVTYNSLIAACGQGVGGRAGGWVGGWVGR